MEQKMSSSWSLQGQEVVINFLLKLPIQSSLESQDSSSISIVIKSYLSRLNTMNTRRGKYLSNL